MPGDDGVAHAKSEGQTGSVIGWDLTANSSSLCEAFQRTAARDPDAVALRTPGDATLITWSQYAQRVRSLAAGLAALGVSRGDTVGLMTSNRPEFHLIDTAVIHLGAVPYSIYNTNPPETVRHLLSNAASRVVICEQQYIDVLRRSGHPIEHLVRIDGVTGDALSLQQVEDSPQPGFDFEATWRAVSPDDLLTLIYTSGTTGPPKGVELTHGNLMAETRACAELFNVRFGDRITSYLPSAHIADRLSCHYLQLRFGTQVTCVADARAIMPALTDARPTIWVAVPRIWEKLKVAVENVMAAETDSAKADLNTWAVQVGLRKVRCEQAGEAISAELAADYRKADEQVFSGLRALIGLDQLRWAMSGAAAIAPEVLEFFLALGVNVCEIWGMSETVGAATANPPHRIKIGTVGIPLHGTELRIADDGEALLRGAIVMRGYRNDPHRTNDVIDAEGWLATGDIVTQDDDGYVSIIDRKKELIINAAGKNMSPSNIENAITAACSIVGNVIAIGDNRPYNVALVVLDPDAAASIASNHDITDTSPASLAANSILKSIVDNGIRAANERLSRVEQIKRFEILPGPWLPGGTFLTPTMKLKRRAVTEAYADVIDRLYEAPRVATTGDNHA